MKKITILFIGIALALTTLSSCSSSIESDAEKVAKIQCEAVKLAKEAFSGDNAVKEKSRDLTNKAKSLLQKLQGKYTTPEDKQKFGQALSKAMTKCN